MSWISPEVFAGIFAAGSGAAIILKKIGVFDLPVTRKGNGAKIHINQRPECKENFTEMFLRVNKLEDDRTENKTRIGFNERRLNRGDDKFDKIMDSLATITAEVKFLARAERKRNGDG